MLVGICGLQGSGKSTLTKELLKRIPNSVSLDIDIIAHNIYNDSTRARLSQWIFQRFLQFSRKFPLKIIRFFGLIML